MYLDLAVTLYLDALARGGTPRLEDFGQPLPAVVARLLRDLDPEERGLLRAAALVDGFDLELLRAALPGVPDAALRRFRDRPFLDTRSTGVWPFTLHDVLRKAVLAADIDLPDSWSRRERGEVARRMTDHLAQVAAAAARSGDHSTEVAAFKHAMHLTDQSGEIPDWVVGTAQRLVMVGRWGAIADETSVDVDGPTAPLHLGLQSARERRSGRMEAAISKARAALERPELSHRLQRFLFPRAEAAYREALELARGTQNTAAEGKALTDIVQTMCWSRPSGVAELLPAAVEVNEALKNNVELVKLHSAAAVAMARQGDFSGAEREIEQGLSLTQRCGYPGGEIWCWVAAVVLRLQTPDTEAAHVAAARVGSITDELAGNRFWAQITSWWLADSTGVVLSDVRPSIQWLDGAETAKERWRIVGGT